MKRVMLLLPSSTYRAGDFIDAATELGAEVIIASDSEQAMASTMGDRALQLPRRQREAAAAIVEHARRTPIDAIVPVDDQGVAPAALAAAELGLPHNPHYAVCTTRDKSGLRRALDGDVPQPRYRVAEPGADVGDLAEEIGFPVVVKPVSLSASRGVIRADDAAAARKAADRIREILQCADERADGPLLVEEFVPGAEVAVEGLLRNGELEILAIFDKPDPLDGPYFEETIYVTPSRQRPDVLERLAAVTRRAVEVTGLVEGPIHAELRIDPDSGEVRFLEIAARSIGGLCARALRFGLGVRLEELILRHALGMSLDDMRREPDASGVMMLPIPRAGVLEQVGGQEEAREVPGIVGLEITVPKGREVEPLPEGDRYLGFLFARGQTPEDVEASLREAHARLDVVIS